jgi:hypothetical protein
MMRMSIRRTRYVIPLLFALGLTATWAEEPAPYYKRAKRPSLDSKTLQKGETRVVMDRVDLENGRIGAVCLREDEVLYRVEVTFTVPPRRWEVGESYSLSTTFRVTGDTGSLDELPQMELRLDPTEAFSVSGFPKSDRPLFFTLGELAAAAGESLDRPLTQRVEVTLSSVERENAEFGYTLLVGKGRDRHEIRLDYPYSRRSRELFRKKRRIERPAEQAEAGAAASAVPDNPWRAPELQRYFAEYIAELTAGVREKRGSEWVVDGWGRLIGPDTVVPLSPPGDWEHPNHYLWEQNVRYPFYARTIRAYLRDRLAGKAEGTVP